MEIIEQAQVEDVAQLADLLAALFSLESDFQPDRSKQERALRLLIEKPDIGRIFVARAGRDVVGMVSLLFTISTAEGGPACWLEDMIIRMDRRSSGLGSRLIQRAIDFARTQGFMRITLLTDHSNTGAVQFYQRHGFTPSEMAILRLHL